MGRSHTNATQPPTIAAHPRDERAPARGAFRAQIAREIFPHHGRAPEVQKSQIA